MLCCESFSITDIGNKREVNQDSYVALDDYKNTNMGLYCVADGMGGLTEGEYASRLATQKTIEWYRERYSLFTKKNVKKNIRKELEALFYNINTKIYLYGRERNIRLGTTYSLILIIGNRYYAVHAGDSRIYLKKEDELFIVSKDETWVNEQVEKGLMTMEEALTHNKKNVLVNCLGYFNSPSISIGEGEIGNEDTFLLCSDGFYNYTDNSEIFNLLSEENKEEHLKNIVEDIKKRGGSDNITAVIVVVKEEDLTV
ncbi:MAG: serine/threonine-protein phosphatase [Firmicutes bacterium]|nr:serine/threonine-protein phosphatase [Bacillota bacterium]